jgi:hypothetical protein
LLRDVAEIVATLVLTVTLVLWFSPNMPGAQTATTMGSMLQDLMTGWAGFRASPGRKLHILLAAFRAYTTWVDGLSVVAFTLPILVLALVHRLRLHAGMVVAGLLLEVVGLVLPAFLAGTAVIDLRFPIMATFILAAAVCPLPMGTMGTALASLLLATSLFRTGSIGWTWQARQADVQALARVLEQVPAGAAILPLQVTARDITAAPAGRYSALGVPTFNHLPTLAIPWRRAFVPTLFAARGKQPVVVLPPWSDIAEPDAGIVADVRVLTDPALFRDAIKGARYLPFWRERFDFVLVVNSDLSGAGAPFTMPTGIDLLQDRGFARLYKISKY